VLVTAVLIAFTLVPRRMRSVQMETDGIGPVPSQSGLEVDDEAA
jgi:hypothetical protein